MIVPILTAPLLVVLFTILLLALGSEIAFWLLIVHAVVRTILEEVWRAVARRRS
jgi:hypothetical protein